MAKLKVLWFNWRCWLNPEMGGAEVFTHEVAKRWAEAGHEVTLFTSQFTGSRKREILDGVQIVRDGGKYSVYWRAKKYYRKHFLEEKHDVVVDEINTRPFFTPKFVNSGQKIVALIHQLAREYWFYETPFPISHFGYYFFEDWWLQNYVNIPTVTVSESTRRDLLDLGFKRLFVVSEGLNFEPLVKISKRAVYPVVVFVGRLKRAKRPDHAIKAFEMVREKIPNAELWILGDGDFQKDLERKGGKGIRFFSGLNEVMRRELIGQSWVLVNPSVREGWGLNIIEANALGVPAVGYDVSGLHDSIKNNETGLLAEAHDIKDLSEKITAVFQDDVLRKRLSKNALEYSRKFNWDKTATQFMKIIKACMVKEK